MTAELQPKIEAEKTRADYWQEQFEKKAATHRMEKRLRKDLEEKRNGWRKATFIATPIGIGAGFLTGLFVNLKLP